MEMKRKESKPKERKIQELRDGKRRKIMGR